MARFENVTVGKLKVKELGISQGSSANLVSKYAAGIADFDGLPTAADTQVIGGCTYTWVADPSATTATIDSSGKITACSVDIGADAAGCATNLAAAINASGTAGTTYSTGVIANRDVTASIGFVDAAGDAVVVSSRIPGTGGNAIVFTESADNTVHYQIDGSTVATTLNGGVDGNNYQDVHNYTNINFYNGHVGSPAAWTDAASTGAVAATTVDTWNTFEYKNNKFFQYNATAQTILVPVQTVDGLSIAGDQVENEIVELGMGITAGEKHSYQVGRDGDLRLRVKMKIDDVSGTDACLVGWRKAEAGQADWNNYDELIAFNVVSGDIKGSLIKNNAATDTDDLGDNWADLETHELELVVGRDGNVTLYIDGSAPTTAHAGALKFDGNEVIVPFIHILQDANLTPVTLIEWECGQILP
jgi:hypothetical protein